MDPTVPWGELVAEVCRRHGTHTVVLYGSRARGDATATSDVDMIAVRATGGPHRDVTTWRGLSLDVHVHDEAGLAALLEQRTPDLVHARVLAQREGFGDALVARVRERLAVPPAPLSDDDWRALWAWSAKMRARVRHPDAALAAFHRATLLVEALASWAQVRRRWFFGGKAALGELLRTDPALHAAWVAAASPAADAAAFDRLLDRVFDPTAAGQPAPEGWRPRGRRDGTPPTASRPESI
jgi:hypothetical protein